MAFGGRSSGRWSANSWKEVARPTGTQAICAIKSFWETTLKREWPHGLELVRAKSQFKLPVVFAAAEVLRALTAVTARDHRVCLSTIYFCGLRLEVRDIDSGGMLLHKRLGKTIRIVTCPCCGARF